MLARSIFDFLHQQTQRSFGEGSYLFFPTARLGTDYSVIVPSTAGTNRGKSQALAGFAVIADDDRVFSVEAAAVPFEPRPEDVVMHGTPRAGTAKNATAVPATNRLTVTAHGYPAGTLLRLGSTLRPAGLEAGREYYVLSPTANDFQLATVPGGPAVALRTAGTALTVSALSADPAAPPRKYELTAADKAEFHTHWRLTAKRH